MIIQTETGWRAAFARQIGTNPGNITRWIERGMPEGDDSAALAWVASNTRHSVASSALDGILADATPDQDGPLGAFARARDAERRIYDLIGGADARELLALVTAHSKACASLAERMEEARSYIEATRLLMPTAEIKAAISGHVGAVVAIARAMPRILSPRMEGMTVTQRTEEMERWVEDTLLDTLRISEPFGS